MAKEKTDGTEMVDLLLVMARVMCLVLAYLKKVLRRKKRTASTKKKQ